MGQNKVDAATLTLGVRSSSRHADGHIENFTAIHQRISFRLGARIWDLRHAGWKIETDELPDKNTVYRLIERPKAEQLGFL